MYLKMQKPQLCPDENTADFKARVIDWIQLMKGSILSTQPELKYVAEIVGNSTNEIEKAGVELSTEQIVKVVERVEVALSHAKFEMEQKQHLQAEQLANRSRLITRLEDDEINLTRMWIENRMFRTPIILIPFALLIASFGLAVLGVIDIRGQKVDVDNIVAQSVNRLTNQLKTEGDNALTTINQALNDKTTEISEYDLNTRIANEVSRHVADKGKNTLDQIELKLNKFNEQFPDKVLSDAISRVKETANLTSLLETKLSTLGRDLARLDQDVLPLRKALDELKEKDQNSFKILSVVLQRAQWMIYAGLIGLIIGTISFLLTVILMYKYNRGKTDKAMQLTSIP